MATDVRMLSQTIEVTQVVDVVVTAVEADASFGGFWREIRIFGTAGEGDPVPIPVTIRIRSDDAAHLRVSVPESEF